MNEMGRAREEMFGMISLSKLSSNMNDIMLSRKYLNFIISFQVSYHDDKEKKMKLPVTLVVLGNYSF